MPFQELRRALAQAGAMIATTRAPGSHGRLEQAETRPATLVEDAALTGHPVGRPTPCPEPVAFLDGIQRHQVIGYVGAAPVIAAVVAAAVRERRGRELVTVIEQRERFLVARPSALQTLSALPADVRTVPLPDLGPWHPIRDIEAALAAIDERRTRLEIRTGEGYRRRSSAWLIVDGSLAESPVWAADTRMLGVAKSHASLPFEGDDLLRYLRLAPGHRTSVFQPGSRRVAPVYAWGLRLWPWEDRDLLFGLVRVEAAPVAGTLARVDTVSRWILAERSPISSGDGRWDRLLYGVHNVEEYLRAATADP